MHPIISALKYHKATVALVVLEVALSCAIVTNALFLIGDRLSAMRITTGVADQSLVWVTSQSLGNDGKSTDAGSRMEVDLAALRGMPGVRQAVMVSALPMLGSSWISGVSTQPGLSKPTQTGINYVRGTPGYVGALGVKLVEGRDFRPQEYVDYTPFGSQPPPPAVIVTQTLAQRLWPGQSALGKPVFLGEQGKYVMHVVGVVGHFLSPSPGNPATNEYNMLLPVRSIPDGMYVLRVQPAARDAVLRDIPAVLNRVSGDRIITGSKTYVQSVQDYFHNDRAMIWLLLVVIGCLLAITALGVVGLSSFWVQQRTHSIGIRRAIGARRGDIMRYFQIENFILVSGGIGLGMALAFALNLFLMKHYELPRLPLYYLLLGAVVLWALGQLAVLGPALRAAAVPPVVATRSV